MNSEDAFIIHCARTVVNQPRAQQIQGLLDKKLDWKYVQQASLRHGVLPLVYNTLSNLGFESVPCNFNKEAKKYCQRTGVRNLLMTSWLIKILKAFREKGISAVPFKGPVFAEKVYSNVGLRDFGDLDILVCPDDVSHSFDLLKGLDFQQAIELSPSQLASYMKTEDDMVFIHRESGLVVELHWELSGRYLSTPLDMRYVRNDLETVLLLDAEVEQLSMEDMLIYLCIHGTRHLWDRLEWVCCIAELVNNKPSLNWDKVLFSAKKLKCSRILCHGLHLANTILETTLPPVVEQGLADDPLLPEITKKVTDRMFPLHNPGQSTAHGYRFNNLQFQIRESKLDQIRYGWRQLTAPREADWRMFPLPSQLTCLYVLLRPYRLCYELLRALSKSGN